MKNKKITVKTVPKSSKKNCWKRCKIDTPNTQVCDYSLSLLSTITSIKHGWVKLHVVVWVYSSLYKNFTGLTLSKVFLFWSPTKLIWFGLA